MKKLTFIKKIISYVLVVTLISQIMPVNVFAEEEQATNIVESNLSGKFYVITSKTNNKAIDVKDAGRNNGAIIHQWDYVEEANQQWLLEGTEDGYYKIISRETAKAIDIKDNANYNGATIHQWEDVDVNSQLWSFEVDNDGYYKIKSKSTGKCLDVKGISSQNGAVLQLWDDVNGDNQKWKLTEIEADTNISSGNTYKITSKQSNKSLEITKGLTDNGIRLQQWDYNDEDYQKWVFEHVKGDYYKIVNKKSNKVIDVKDLATNNGTMIHQWDYAGKDNQLWRFEKDKDGYYKIKSLQSGKCLDIAAISSENGAKIQLWDDVDGDNQKWTIEKTIIDSDDDGISDDYEKDVLIQAMIDSGQEYGNPDPNADYDSDGLTNLEEYNLGTNPASKDTDEDGLSDYDEVNVYKTNPNLYDTDGDGIGDGSEIQNGLNPLSTDTDGNGILDGDEVFDKVLLDSKYEDFDIDATGTIPNVTIKGKGDFNTKIEIKDESNNEKFAQINSMVGSPFNFEHDDTLEFESSTLTFKVSDKILSQHELSNLKIAYYNEETNSIEILESSLDEEKKEVTTNVDHFSTYFLIDVEDFEYDIDILNENSKIDTGKADVVFTIDTTGSMYSSIYNVKNNIKEVVSKLKEDKVDVRLGLVGFKDITCDGLYSTKDYGWFTDVDNFKSAVNSLIASGGGDWEESTVDGLEVSRRKDFRSSVTKYIVLITDAGYKIGTADNPSMTMEEEIELLKKDNISTSVITNSSAKGYFTSLYTETNGIIADINGNFSEILQPLIEKMATISSDGVWIRLSNGSIVKLDKDPALGDYSVDTDGDGVPDLSELTKEVSVGYFDYNTHKTVTYKYWTFYSNPTKKDTDGDGLTDKTDLYPSKFDVSIKEDNDKYVVFNTGNKWTKFGEDIYGFHKKLTDTTTSIHTSLDYQRFLESDLYKKEQILVKNRKLKLSTDELATLVALDINGVRDYLTNKSDSTINKVYTKVTGKKPHYYKHQWNGGWTDKGEKALEKSWLDFFSGDVVTDARATLTLYYSLDLNKVIMDVAFVGIVIGSTYLGLSELTIILEGMSMFGAVNTLNMYLYKDSDYIEHLISYEKVEGPQFFFRGTTIGYQSTRLEQCGVTPVSANPLVSTAFATEAENSYYEAEGVLYIAKRETIQGILSEEGNVSAGSLAVLERECTVNAKPLEFAEIADIAITPAESRAILKEMGFDIPSTLKGKQRLNNFIHEAPKMSEEQISEYMRRVAELIAKR